CRAFFIRKGNPGPMRERSCTPKSRALNSRMLRSSRRWPSSKWKVSTASRRRRSTKERLVTVNRSSLTSIPRRKRILNGNASRMSSCRRRWPTLFSHHVTKRAIARMRRCCRKYCGRLPISNQKLKKARTKRDIFRRSSRRDRGACRVREYLMDIELAPAQPVHGCDRESGYPRSRTKSREQQELKI